MDCVAFAMRRTRKQIEEERRQLRKEYGDLFDSITGILFRNDPIGINFGDNPDEYDPEARTILPRLKICRSSEDVPLVVHEEFVRWFSPHDAGPIERYKKIASEVWALWSNRSDTRC
jgi:hypothetical protein